MSTFFMHFNVAHYRLTVPTILTIVRMILSPCIVVLVLKQYWLSAALLFMIAALTDLLDGYYARLWNDHTLLGACLDPIADKLLLLSCFSVFAYIQTIPRWFLLIVLLKEIIIIIGVVVLFFIKKKGEIKPTLLGKLVTVIQMFFIMWLFGSYYFDYSSLHINLFILSLLLFFVLASLIQYITLGVRLLIQ